MLILLVRTHTLRTTIIEHQRVGILNSPENLPGKMQWNKLLTIFLPWHLFFLNLYSSFPHLLADQNVVFGSSSVWAQEVCHWVNLQSLLLHICHILRKYYPRKIHQHNTSAPKCTAHLACKRVKETNEMQKVIYTEVSKWATKL